jgi:hypothetical protein
MTLKNSLRLLAILALHLSAHAQPIDVPTLVQFRATLHDPIKPTADLFFTDKNGAVVPLELRRRELSKPQLTPLVNGTLILYDKLAVDPKKPEASIAATCKIPAGTKRAIIIILPSPAETKPAYRMVCIDDSAKEFPKGESKVLTLITAEAAIEAGEHKLPIHPAIITRVPPVKKVNEYNMAQTKIYYKLKDNWTIVDEYSLQYADGFRRIFILHATPGALQPSVGIIEDTTSPTAPLLTR